MAINKLLESYLAQIICSDQLRRLRHNWSDFTRKVLRSGHHATFYFDLEDPYSALMLPVIEELEQAYKISFNVKVIEPRNSSFLPEQDALERYSLVDAGYQAQAWGLEFPALIPNQKRLKVEALRLLLKQRTTFSEWLQIAKDVSDAYWHGDFSRLHSLLKHKGAIDRLDVTAQLKSNTDDFYRRGFYLSSSIEYRGEWYWSLDRLYLLRARLNRFSAQEHKTKFYPDWGNARVPCRPKDPTDLFFSFRSPYSYIAIARIFKHKDRYPVDGITLKPVLPMVTRGLAVPKAKKMYILQDAARIAHYEKLPFGRVWDPLGAGVSACLALFDETPVDLRFDLTYRLLSDIWANGKDVSSEGYIETVCADFRLMKDDVLKNIRTSGYSEHAELNRKELTRNGLWGVPSFKKGKLVAWGQDRMPLIFSRAFK